MHPDFVKLALGDNREIFPSASLMQVLVNTPKIKATKITYCISVWNKMKTEATAWNTTL